jgi:hypothetical protein
VKFKNYFLFSMSALLGLAISAMPLSAFAQGGDRDLAPGQKTIHTIRTNPQGNPIGEGLGQSRPSAKPTSNNGIFYGGGPLMLGVPSMYYIWYGNWSGNTATNILVDFANNIGGSPYYNINTTYYDGTGTRVTNAVVLGGQTFDTTYKYGTSLTDTAIRSIVTDAITSGRLPKDTNGIYFVLTSADVTASSGFCTQYCGWHTWGTISGSAIKYSFIGNSARCPSACAAQSVGPNGNAGADGMASIIAHELEEAVTDPQPLSGWADRRGAENADKCAWTFGATYTTANGATANMRLGTRDYLIQQNWVNALGGYCAKSY